MKRFQEKIARIETLISMEGAVGGGDVSESLEEFFSDRTDREIAEIFGECPKLLDEAIEEGWLKECIESFVFQHGKTGYLCEFACPVKKRYSSAGCTFAWNEYHLNWIYGKTMEEVLDAGFAWVDEMDAKDKAKEPA